MNARSMMTGLLWERLLKSTAPVQLVRPVVLLPAAVCRPQDWAFRWERL